MGEGVKQLGMDRGQTAGLFEPPRGDDRMPSNEDLRLFCDAKKKLIRGGRSLRPL